MIARQPLCAAVGMTQADRVMPVVRLSDAELGTTMTSLTPSKLRAPPNRPSADHVAPEIVPVLLLPETSETVLPLPSLKPHAPTRPDWACDTAGAATRVRKPAARGSHEGTGNRLEFVVCCVNVPPRTAGNSCGDRYLPTTWLSKIGTARQAEICTARIPTQRGGVPSQATNCGPAATPRSLGAPTGRIGLLARILRPFRAVL